MQDLTKGNPLRQILIFAIPVLFGNLFQELYNVVDTLVVGRTLGSDALAAVGATGSVTWLVTGFCIGFTTGCSIVTAQRVGAKNADEVRRSIATHVILAALFAVVLTAGCILAANPLLRLIRTPDNIIDDAQRYVVVIFAGLGATLLYNLLSGTMRALGDSRTPLYFLALASLLNIGGDVFLIVVCDLGVMGAALATVGAQLISGLACLVYIIFKMPAMHIHRADLRVGWERIWAHLRLGIPTGLQFSITAIGMIVLQSVLNQFGSDAVAGNTVGARVNSLCMNPLITLGTALSTFVGQNQGAGLYARIREGVNKTLLVAEGFAVLLGAAAVVFVNPIIAAFVSEGSPEAVYSYAREYIYWCSIFLFILAALFVYRNALQGLGDSTSTMLGAAMELLMRIILPTTLAGVMGFTVICLASPAAWLLCTVPLMLIYFWRMRRMSASAAS